MGLFDKLKASVGVGGATLELHVPRIVTSESTVPIRATVRGGKIEQKLDGVLASLEVWPERIPSTDGKPAPGPAVEALGKLPGSTGKTIQPGAQLVFEHGFTAPACQALYAASPERYAQLVVESEEDPTLWAGEGPLPMISDWESATVHLTASADIPGAIDPAAKVRLFVIPEAAGKLSPAGAITEEALEARLGAAGAHRAFVSSSEDQWFVWWARGDGRVVAHSPIQVVCSVRPEGVVRGYLNERIPEPSRLAKQASDTGQAVPGGPDEAQQLARRVIAEAGAGVLLPRMVSNAWVTLTDLRIL